MNRKVFKTMVTGGLLALTALVGVAWAKDFPQRSQLDASSRREGFGRSSVALLKRMPGRGGEAVAAAVIRQFESASTAITTSGERKREAKRDKIFVHTDAWSLQVVGDGTRVSYRNEMELDRGQANGVPVAQRLSDERLEELGRGFIAGTLQALVKLGPDEALVPLYTERQITGGGPTAEGAQPETELVVANTMVFTRTIDGVPVVGGGSKVAVTFLNNGNAVAFSYDWPEYRKTGRQQKVLGLDEIKRRGKRVLSVDLDAENVKLARFECGLFDPGVRYRDADALVQSACYVQAVRRDIIDPAANRLDPTAGHVLAAVAQAIPAGATVEPDKRWPEAEKLRGRKLVVAPAPPTGPAER